MVSLKQFRKMKIFLVTWPPEKRFYLHLSSFKNSYNNELVKCLEDLSTKREAIAKEILSEEEEKNKLQNDLRIFSERLARINESLSKKIAARWE